MSTDSKPNKSNFVFPSKMVKSLLPIFQLYLLKQYLMNYAQQIVHHPQPILQFLLVKYSPMNYASKMVQRTKPVLQFQLIKYSAMTYASKMVQRTEPILKLIIKNRTHHNRSTRSSLTIALLILLSPHLYYDLRSGVRTSHWKVIFMFCGNKLVHPLLLNSTNMFPL